MKENYWLSQPEELSNDTNTNDNTKFHQHHHHHSQQKQKELRDNEHWPVAHEREIKSAPSAEVNNNRLDGDAIVRCRDQNQIREDKSNNNNNNSNTDLSSDQRLFDSDSKELQRPADGNQQQLDQQVRSEQKLQSPPSVRQDAPNEINLSFCGCGFLGIYHVGVASCFHQYAPQLSMHKIAGSSAGALVAVAHICGNLQLAYATTDILRVAIDARARALGPFHPSFDINATVREALERGLPDDVHVRASGKLHISLTRAYDGTNVIINEFDSKDEVIQALLCSCFIPFWSGLQAPKFRGTTYIDGGFSNNQLRLDNKTVAVSPFAGEADICPQDDSLNLLQISLSNTSFSISPNNLYRLSHALLPPPPEVLSDLCEQGFADGIRFLQRMKLISCTKCLEIRSSLLVTTNGEDMEEAFREQQQQHNQVSESIRLEQQEQKMIEINDDGIVHTQHHHRARKSSTTSRATTTTTTNIFQQQKHATTNSQGGDGGDHCSECVIIRQRALYDPLPAQFSDRIRDACDAVNKSLSNWIYSYRPVKYLSYLAFTPVDVSLALVLRCWQELPLIRSELINFICNMAKFLLNLIRQILTRSTSALLMDAECQPSVVGGLDGDAEEYEKEIALFQVRKAQSDAEQTGDATSTTNTTHKYPPHHHHYNNKQAETDTRIISTELPMFLFPQATTDSALSSSSQPTTITAATSGGSTNQLHSLEDTFDSIVDVTSNQEARIFAYYFRDAKNRLQVTEIFDLERAAELSQSNRSLHSSSLSLHSNTN